MILRQDVTREMSSEIDVATCFVAGRPRTKGSLKPIVNWATQKVHMEEEVRLSKPWRTKITNTVIREVTAVQHVNRSWQMRPGFPWAVPVIIDLSFRFDRERGDGGPWPMGITYGDVDKLTRNVLDALTDAKLYADDSFVVSVRAGKRFTFGDELAGVSIVARRFVE